MQNCLCCADRLLHCVRNRRQFWFCRTCWQEFPCNYYADNQWREDFMPDGGDILRSQV